ncbi:MAG: glucose-1-phosphate adenylyltransferase subunit GlgD, partial [Clostridia bacterium]|nr:glucose-1-phosphate adenylyltransferase subunit GlgD [Clostridia bacterium]
AKFTETAKVKNSLIADGCLIEGTVENSILFRGVKVGKGSVVKNCIIMSDDIIGENCNLAYIISDKDSVIRDNRVLAGCEIQPFFINKGTLI